MKEHPIIFNGEMVRAILDGRKTQTRRIIKPMPLPECDSCVDIDYGRFIFGTLSRDGLTKTIHESIKCPYGQAGDSLYVRERLEKDKIFWCYYSDKVIVEVSEEDRTAAVGWAFHKEQDYCPSIHMPKWASRIHLEITDIRIERVQDISEQDAAAEGCPTPVPGDGPKLPNLWFRKLWDRINGKTEKDWHSNPWVWVVEFKRIEK